ncbi:MAG: hypothetical protein EBZ03_10335 [Betaproteobacteria bacterium]|nr:hypothetical protein [Betaproteobacteria bacterium]NBQ82219.1 hypothetical protein [Betaproteobacteria bacterium]NCU99315.1 hypothetical protein [Betaproteobacteria bacterium]NCV61825.1 hypothetical protein [Betaproteobacteria bacterium]NCW97716.1 hypothetical protein [Betaproteobacteria bacterium]
MTKPAKDGKSASGGRPRQAARPGDRTAAKEAKIHPAFLLILPLFALLLVMSAPRDALPSRAEVPPKAPAKLVAESELLHRGPTVSTPSVHAITVTALAGGRLLAAWFGGTREGAIDVSISTALFDGRQWSQPRVVLRPEDVSNGSQQWVRKLGNPVLHVDRSGYVHLFVTSVAIGGWATAMIEHFRSADGGQSFEHQERLALSPFLNLSHLVRAPAIALKGGGFILPVYFELGSKYGVLLRFNAQGRFVHRERMDGPPHLLQPWAVVHDERMVEFYFRDAAELDPRVWLGRLDRSEPTRALLIKNPDSAVAAIPSFDGASWLVRNPESRGRETLVLQRMNALQQPTDTMVLAKGREGDEFSYPVIAQTDDGRIHVLYTDRRKAFAHRVFRAQGL